MEKISFPAAGTRTFRIRVVQRRQDRRYRRQYALRDPHGDRIRSRRRQPAARPAHRCGRVVADAERQYRMVHTGPHIGQNLHVVRGHGDRKRVVETLRDAYLHRPGLRSGRRHRDTERRCLPGFRGRAGRRPARCVGQPQTRRHKLPAAGIQLRRRQRRQGGRPAGG